MNLAGLPLFGGWFVLSLELAAAVAILAAVRWRHRLTRRLWLPLAAAAAVAASAATYWVLGSRDLAPEAAPWTFWIWLSLTVGLMFLVPAAWIGNHWWRRITGMVAVGLTVVCLGLAANQWAGFYPTAGRAWQGLTAQPLPGQISFATLSHLRGNPEPDGKIVPLRTSDSVSRFHHRTEYVYLPPVWFAGDVPPRLPAVVMIGGVVTTPEDWVRSGSALQTVRDYAATHHGQAPILVFVDPTGSLSNDTECVDGPHGNVDTHITKEVRPAVISEFGASDRPGSWAVAGWSMGGTCAIDLTVEHPDLFRTFLDVSGDVGPNLGDRAQTTSTLFGGRAADWDRFDPATAMRRHGPYCGVSGWFQSEGHRHHGSGLTSPQIRATQTLSTVAHEQGIDVVVRPVPGRHNWQFAGQAFTDALPWLMARVDAPN
ncbi:alpha/beta hydrolase [Gordonia rubripertincta]|uniref:Alpha/beta hydrolase-fold protein n=1 Tax=Gordonia rubripertincta TaxID=36822 RepID=A0ABT4MRS9_GORRU|nr:alpha/beta hydrolase-fold protein [Gordonia rubripertincta]MCZ4548437.1 alpha/beta hydrolase-fold protein [Gordonia rubripertincta]